VFNPVWTLVANVISSQRLKAIESFRSGTCTHLLATDLASRGLDIKNISTVINYSTPQTHEIYLHRVGRTARAGRSGRAVTLAAEPDRKVVRAAVKAARAQGAKVVSRTVPLDAVHAWSKRLQELEDAVEGVLEEEREERAFQTAERDIAKHENIEKHKAEILSRPKRTWFETEKEKKESKLRGMRELNGVDINGAAARATEGKGMKKEKKKLSNKQKKKLEAKDERKKGLGPKGKTKAMRAGGTGHGAPQMNGKGGKRGKMKAKGVKR
jgi:ATP-dependent RNA helicase DDX27